MIKVSAGIGKKRSAKSKSATREQILILKVFGPQKVELYLKQ